MNVRRAVRREIERHVISTEVVRVLRGVAFAVALLPALAWAAEPVRQRVTVGVGERFTAKQQMRKTLTTPGKTLHYLAEHTTSTGGTLPSDWMQKWITSDLAGHGYRPARTERARIWLVFEWGSMDPMITHFGPPAQDVELRGRPLLEPREAKSARSETTPFCSVTCYDIADVLKPAAARVPLWRAKMWLVFLKPQLREQVEVGPLVFKEYVEGDPKADTAR
jgi:hypothetical protein